MANDGYNSKYTGAEVEALLDQVAAGGGGSGGGSVDPEILEGFIPLQRQFSDDFNNDFAR